MGAGGEAAEEPLEVSFAVALELLDHVAEEGAGRGGGEHRGGAHGRGDAIIAGEGVEDGGEQLAAQDLLGGEVGAGGADGAVEEVEGVVVEPGGAAAAGDEGDVQGVAGLAPGAAHALEVAGDGLRDGGEQHGGEVADVDAHLEGGGGDEDVRGAGRLGAVLEARLVGEAVLGGQQGGVLAGDDAAHVALVEAAVVGGAQCAGAERAWAAVAQARPVLQRGEDGVGAGDGLAAFVADEHRGRILGGAGGAAGFDAVRDQREAAQAAGGLDDVDQPELGERVEERAQEGRGGAAVAGERTSGPVGVPAGAGGRVLELAPGSLAADAGQLREGAAGGEGGHELRLGASAPELVHGPAFAAEGPQPFVGDRAVGAEAFEDAAHPAAAHGRVVPIELTDARAEGAFGGLVELVVCGPHLGEGRAGEQEGAAHLAGETQLQADVEGEALDDASGGAFPVAGAEATTTVRVLVPVGGELVGVGDGGVQQPVALLVGGGLREHPLDDGADRGGLGGERLVDHRAHGEAVGASLDEAGAVGGVLHGVGEDERLLLLQVQARRAEEAGEGDGEQGREPCAEEADAVLLAAGGAGLVVGVLVRVEPGVHEHAEH